MLPSAELVYDHKTLRVPTAMGTAKEGQLVGTELENFGELCGRICYDSLGKGRGSHDFHQNILDTHHYNIYEGCVRTFETIKHPSVPVTLLNRPGVWCVDDGNNWRITLNARAVIEWDRHTKIPSPTEKSIRDGFRTWYYTFMPWVIKKPEIPSSFELKPVEPKFEHEMWISLWLKTSRAVSHEQVRHRWMCHLSQRSTRYCDETKTERIEHPLIRAYRAECGPIEAADDFKNRSNAVYQEVYDKLHPWLVAQGMDARSARKQARGVAREYLEHQLATQMIFGGSVEAWKWMIDQRGSKWADGAIQELYLTEIVEALKESQYARYFG